MTRTSLRTLRLSAPLAALLMIGVFPSPSVAEHTTEPPFLTLAPGVSGTLVPIIESGDTHDGVLFEGIPDGLGIIPGEDTVTVFVNHEQTRVPFQGSADFVDSSVTRWVLDESGAVLDASVAIPSSDGFDRFCSSFMAGPDQGFETYTLFTNEEADDVLDVPPGAPYGPDPSVAPQRQAGYAVALNTETGQYKPVAGMGRHNHENSMVVPGKRWGQIAVISGDDTFNPPSSQLYLYLAENEQDVRADQGSLWAFRVTRGPEGRVDPADPFNGVNDYGDISVGERFRGEFIRVPDDIADGTTAARPQAALESWSNENNVFQFIRIEDTAYNLKRPRTVYLADTSTTRIFPDPNTGRLFRAPSTPAPDPPAGLYPNGRIFQMKFDKRDPRKVDSLKILLDNDAGGAGNPPVMHQPDNLDTSTRSLMVQEDSAQPPNSRIWRYDFASGTWSVVASVNESAWESSGIVNASEVYGRGAWLLDVQAHGDFVNSETIGSVTFKREQGQLLLMTLPGS